MNHDDDAIREVAARIEWKDDVPVIVGLYYDDNNEEEDTLEDQDD